MYRNRIGLTFTLLLVAVSGSINAMSDGSEDQKKFEHLISVLEYKKARELLLMGQVDVRRNVFKNQEERELLLFFEGPLNVGQESKYDGDLLNYAVRSIDEVCAACGARLFCECTREYKRQRRGQKGQELHSLIVEMLAKRGPLVKEEQSEDEMWKLQDTLSYAVAAKYIPAAIVRELLKYGVKPEKMLKRVYGQDTERSFLGCAIAGSTIAGSTTEKTRLLLEHGADPQDGKPLNFVGPCTKPEAAELLAFWGADPEGMLRSLLYWPEMRNAITCGVEERKKSMATAALCLEEQAANAESSVGEGTDPRLMNYMLQRMFALEE